MLSFLALIICCLILLFQMYADKRNGSFNIFKITYLFQLYYIIQLPLSSCFSELFGYYRIQSRITAKVSENARTEMLIIVMVAQLFFAFGSCLMAKKRIKPVIVYPTRWIDKRVKIMIIILILFGYGLFFNLMRSYGGIRSFLAQIEYFRNVGLNGMALYTVGISKIMPLALPIYMLSNKYELRENKRIINMLILGFICVIPMFFLGFRSYIFAFLIMVLCTFHCAVKKIKPRFFVIGIISFAVYFSFYSLARITSFTVDNFRVALFNIGESFLKLLLRVRGSEVVGIVIDRMHTDTNMRLSFDIFVNGITNIIPSAIWPGKPTALSILFSQTFFGKYGIRSGISATCIGEFYWEYGPIGTVICMFFLGAIVTLIQNRVMSDLQNNNCVLSYSLFLWTFIYMSECFSGALNVVLIYCVVLFLIKCFLTGYISFAGSEP